MAFNFNFSWGSQIKEPLTVEHDKQGNWMYWMFGTKSRAKPFATEQQKINAILSNPACLKVFALNCDLFSLGKINTPNEEEYLKTKRKRPNFKQTWTQWYWDYMFWCMTGTAYLWKTGGRILDDYNTLQWLNPAKIDWQPSTLKKLKDLILTKATYAEVMKQSVRYDTGDGQFKYIPLREITPLHDLSSGPNDNFYQGISRIDALYKIISNSEQVLDAKSINVEFSRKFIISGMQNPDNINQLPMGEDERKDIRAKVRDGYDEIITKSQVDIKRFIENLANLKLDDAYASDYYNIGSMFGIPRDILEVYNSKGSTYENQEKSIVRHIEYSLKPKGKDLTNTLEDLLDIDDTEMTWDHLACYQVFEAEKQNVIKLKLENTILANANNIKIDEL